MRCEGETVKVVNDTRLKGLNLSVCRNRKECHVVNGPGHVKGVIAGETKEKGVIRVR